MSTRQSRFMLVDSSVHVDIRRDDLPPASGNAENDPSQANAWFTRYLKEEGAFVWEHESRHVHQLMAFPALYIRAVREARWAQACLGDFRDRGDIDFDPFGQHRIVIAPSAPEIMFLKRNYRNTVVPHLAGTNEEGRLLWGDDPDLARLNWSRLVSELTLVEAEALAVQFRVATRRGFDGTFGAWARSIGTNPTPINDLVTVLCSTSESRPAERFILTWLPALVWHAFHTTWPVTAFFNFLETILMNSSIDDLGQLDAVTAFAIVGSVRYGDRFVAHCPILNRTRILDTVRDAVPVNEPFVQFDPADSTWQSLAEAAPDYPLADAISFKLGGRWPDPLDFIDPSPDMLVHLQAAYPATALIVRVAPAREQDHGFYRRWIPRVPWRTSQSDGFVGRLTLLEIAQTIMANVYMGVLPPEARFTGEVKHTCWHDTCPVFPTGLCRFWDAIPPRYTDCEFLQSMPNALWHRIDPTEPGRLKKQQPEGVFMPQNLIVTADDQDVLKELADELQDDETVNPRDVQYHQPEVPGQLGEPVTIAILILLGHGAAIGVGTFAGKKMAEGVWNILTGWHSRHKAAAHYAIEDEKGSTRPLTAEESRELDGPAAK